MLLTDRDIRRAVAGGELGLYPFEDEQVQPSSVDVRLGAEFQGLHREGMGYLDPTEDASHAFYKVDVPEGQPIILNPGAFMLGTTVESLRLPFNLAARLEGKSSLGRLGLLLHATAGFIDPGFRGNVTLELANLTSWPIRLWPGMRIGQLCFFSMTGNVDTPYGSTALGSHYQGQVGATLPAPQAAL